MDLDALKAHLTSLGELPALSVTDTELPVQLTDLLATFPDGTCQGTAGSQAPRIDSGRTELTFVLACASTVWPVGGKVTLAVTGVTVTVSADGSVSLVLSGAFDTVQVVSTVTEGEDGRLTAAVRPRQAGAFANALDELGGRFAEPAVWRSAVEGLHAFDFAARDIAGFDYRLTWNEDAVPAAYEVTSMAVVAALDLKALPLDIAVWLPELRVTGELHDDKPVTIRSLLESFDLPSGEVPESLVLGELSFAALLGDAYLLRMKVTGDWEIGPFSITALSMYLYYDAEQKFVTQFAGTVSISESIAISVSAAQVGGDTGGWTFSGGLAAGAIGVADVIDALHLPDVPQPLKSLKLTGLWLTHTTGTEIYEFLCHGEITIADGITAELGLTATRDGSTTHYGGTLSVDGFAFEVALDHEKSGADVLAATYHAPRDGGQIALRDWVAHFSEELAADVPDSLKIGLKDAKFVRVKPQSGPPVFALGVDLSAGIDLAQLPLVGGFLSEVGSLGVDDLQVLYSSGVFDGAATASANALLTQAGVVALPAGGLKAGPAALAALKIGAESVPVALGLPTAAGSTGGTGGTGGTGSSTGNTGGSGTPAPAPSTPSTPSAPATPSTPAKPTGSSTGVWITVQKQLGVIQINRIGVLYQNNALLFGLDAGVQLGPLALSLDGLAVGSALDKFAPAFQLDGVGVGYMAPPVEIAGALLRIPPAQLDDGVLFQFDGSATIAVPDFSLAAIGSYAQLEDGWPSLFLFGQLEAPLGGPPPILVTGLMVGFGFNRELKLPSAGEVSGFPLLTLNKQGPDAPKRPSEVLDVLEGRVPAAPGKEPYKWIAPKEGSYWLALGIEFTVAELVNAKVLLAAEFGQELALAVLGLATLQLPIPAESATRTYVYAELGLEAEIKPLSGSIEIGAQLASASYVLTPDCHLTGGFGAAVWFGPHPNAGQFVVTLGGYHPAFRRPAHYPDPPRLGINWAVSSKVSITAEAYLAVTPSCAMAGGRLSINFHAGDFRAWFTAQADLLLSWRPFFFTARISVSIGASYTVNAGFVHKTFSVSVGADLELWGPPTAGSVTAHFVGFSKTISFGSRSAGTDAKALEWDEFASMLPKAADVVTIAPVNGIDKAVDDTAAHDPGNSGKAWYVRARDLRFFTQSAVPASHLRVGPDSLASPQSGDGLGVDIRPMDRSGLVGEHRLTLYYGNAPASMDGWTFAPRTHNLPASLWGAPPSPFSHTPDAPSADVLADRAVGFDVQAPRPELATSRGVFPLSEYTSDEIPPGLAPLPSSPVADRDYVPVPDDACVERIARIDRGTARGGRDQVWAALADAKLLDGPSDALTALAAGAGHLYSQAPMVQNPAQN